MIYEISKYGMDSLVQVNASSTEAKISEVKYKESEAKVEFYQKLLEDHVKQTKESTTTNNAFTLEVMNRMIGKI